MNRHFCYNDLMRRYFVVFIFAVVFISSVFSFVFGQQEPMLTVTLHSETSVAKYISAEAQYVDVARITLTVSGGDVYLNGIYVDADVSGGLSNFTNIYIYDTEGSSLLGYYPNQSENPNLVQFSNVIIGNGKSKTYLVKASLASSAAGNVRVGFSGFTYPTQAQPALSGIPIYGNTMTLPGTVVTPIPTPSLTPTPLTSPEPLAEVGNPTSLGFTSLSALNLREGDTISAPGSNDPDIYIPNEHGYKRLFLNPVIFGFYGHLGGFSAVKNTSSSTRDTLVTSGLFRNCETDDQKVYGVETTGEDTGVLHWVNTSGEQAVADDADFFKKVFCINSNEFNWYQKGSDYTSVNQVPAYTR